jgi:hypothetical protein
MKIFFDTEFIEDGRTIDLISIAMVREDGAELYLCNTDAKLHMASDWVRKNVLPHLPGYGDPRWRTRAQIADRVRAFCLETFIYDDKSTKPQLWAYYADYDWVALCQLFGLMIDLPKGFPMYCMDLKQWSVMLGDPDHPKQASGEHDALADARWNRELYRFLEERSREKYPNA